MKYIFYSIFFLLAMSIWTILGIELSIVPLFPSNFSINVISKINNIFLVLSYSFISAIIFYYFTSILPRQIQIRRSKKIVFFQVNYLLGELQQILSHILYTYDVSKEIEDVENKDLIHIDGDVRGSYVGYFRGSLNKERPMPKEGDITNFGAISFRYPEDIKEKLRALPEYVRKIRISIPNYHVDEDFAQVLSSIESNELIDWYVTKDNELFKFASSSKKVYSLIEDYKKLRGLKYHRKFSRYKHYFHYYLKDQVNMSYSYDQHIEETKPLREAILNLKPCVIFNPQNGNVRPILTVIRRNFFPISYQITRGGDRNKPGILKEIEYRDKIINTSQSTFFVIIEYDIPRKEINEFIKRNRSKSFIVLLRPTLIFSLRRRFETKFNFKFGLTNIYFPSSFSFLSFHINKKHPTEEQITEIFRKIKDMLEQISGDNSTSG